MSVSIYEIIQRFYLQYFVSRTGSYVVGTDSAQWIQGAIVVPRAADVHSVVRRQINQVVTHVTCLELETMATLVNKNYY